MNAIFSFQKKHTSLIFNGRKPVDFKNKIGKDIKENDIIYIYETKRNGGSGMVVGEVRINKIIEIKKYPKFGAYTMLPYFCNLFGTEEEKRQVEKAMSIHVSHYDDSITLDYIFDDWTLDYMKKNDEVPDRFHIEHQSLKEYGLISDRAHNLCKRCDEWAIEIGFYNDDECSLWKYIIELKNPILYEKPKKITGFHDKNGEPITKAPCPWCYVQE